jgi:hypothetical protein
VSSTSSRAEREAREHITEAERAEAEQGRGRAATLFDLRRVIGGLLSVYGAMLTVMGLFESSADKAKAAGININLWAGLAMLAVGLAFLGWALWRPLRAEDLGDDDQGGRDQSDRRAAVE